MAVPYLQAPDDSKPPASVQPPSSRPWYSTAARMIAYHVANFPFSIATYCFLCFCISVAVCFMPFCGVGAMLLIFCADMVDLFARWDIALSNFVTQPADQVCVKGLLDNQSQQSLVFAPGEMLGNIALASSRVAWGVVVYFVSVKLVLAIGGAAALAFTFATAVVAGLDHAFVGMMEYRDHPAWYIVLAVAFTVLGAVGVVLFSVVGARCTRHFSRHYIADVMPPQV